MKKIIALLLSCVMVIASCFTVMANENDIGAQILEQVLSLQENKELDYVVKKVSKTEIETVDKSMSEKSLHSYDNYSNSRICFTK